MIKNRQGTHSAGFLRLKMCLAVICPAVLAVINVQAASTPSDPITNGLHVGTLTWYDAGRFDPPFLVTGDSRGPLADSNANGIEEHDRTGEQILWMTQLPGAGSRWLMFNLNGRFSLQKIRIWNHNGPDTGRQLQTAPIEYSMDGFTWTLITNLTFKQIVPADLLEDVDDVDAGGVQASLVRIGNPTNGWTNYGDVWGAGLSEVKFYGPSVARNVFRVSGSDITATASSEGAAWGRYASNTVNGAGILADADDDGIPPHDTTDSHMWMCQPAQANVSNQWIQFEFSQAVSLDHMRVWNWNYTGSANDLYEVKAARIRHSMDGSAWTTVTDAALFTKSLGTSGYESVDQFSFGGVQARYVRLDNLANFKSDNSDGVGLSEVWFYARNTTFGGTVFRFQ